MNNVPTLGRKVVGILTVLVTIAAWALAIGFVCLTAWQINEVYQVIPL